jgi:hypothetical protein
LGEEAGQGLSVGSVGQSDAGGVPELMGERLAERIAERIAGRALEGDGPRLEREVAGEGAKPVRKTAGFAARLTGATLFDLVQFECLERSQRIVRVSNGTRVGFLYFRAGNVVHAVQGPDVGEPAVRRMLRWEGGAFESCDGPWPARETIQAAWQGVLMGAAQAEDEERDRTRDKNRVPRVLPFPPREPVAAASVARSEEHVNNRSAGAGGTSGTASVGATTWRLTPDGELASGSPPPELVETVAYAARMADLVGEVLCLEEFTAVELTLSDGACVVTRAPNGDLLAARGGRTVDVAALRRTLVGQTRTIEGNS